MNIHTRKFKVDLSEADLREAVVMYLESKGVSDIKKVSHIKHNVGEREEEYGGRGIGIPYQEGITVTLEVKCDVY